MKIIKFNFLENKKRLSTILLLVFALLSVPLIAMFFTNEVKWTLLDFFAAGVLLFSAGVSIEFICRKVTKTQTRIVFCGLLLFLFFLIWIELAVGVFGTTIAGN